MSSWWMALAAVALAAPPAGSQVVVNEVLPAPGTDWTQNGTPSPQEDEWVELYNAGGAAVDLTGWFLGDGAGGAAVPRIGLSGPLAPGDYLFLTGELAIDWEAIHGFPAVGLSLNNAGDVVYLFQVAGGATTLVDSLAWTGSTPDVSLGRLPDGTGPITVFDALTPGGTGPQPTPGGPNGGIASPKILSYDVTPPYPTSADSIAVRAVAADADGIAQALVLLRVNGGAQQQVAMAQVLGTPTYGTWETVLGPYAAGTVLDVAIRVSDGSLLEQTNDVRLTVASGVSPVVLNEILADPPPGLAGDANGDGVRGTADDEFIEILNRSGSPADLTGWSIEDATGVRHHFTAGPVLQPGEMWVVFGGGSPSGIPSGSEVASSGSLSLNNTGDDVKLVDASGVVADAHTYGSEANADQSLIRVPDGDGPWTRPGDVGYSWAFSPGSRNETSTALGERSWAAVKALYR